MASASAKTTPNFSYYLPLCRRHYYLSPSKLSFCLSNKPTICLSTKDLQSSWKHSTVVKAQLNEVAVDGSSNASATSSTKSKVPATEAKDAKPSSEPSPAILASKESISEFIAQVANLVKLVDSRDIAELHLKQFDCELLIRKKEAMLPLPASAPVMMQAPAPPASNPPAYLPAAPSSPSALSPSSGAAPAASPSAPKSSKSSHPPLKCPMAGTFYRSPAPGEPACVKVGDKVQKGQVLCIIEAMKLMNEIEADQSGTVAEILVEDGKPVSVEMPLFVIEP